MRGHLGPRVSALVDGQLSPVEAEQCWEHVHECHFCRDAVEREGWIKTRLAGLSLGGERSTPDHLKGSLAQGGFLAPAALHAPAPARARSGVTFLGGTALGAAVVGVVALGMAPGATNPNDRRPPVTNLTRPATVTATPTASSVGLPVATHRVSGGIAGFKRVP